MNKRLLLGTTLLLTLGTAVAGTWMYGNGQASGFDGSVQIRTTSRSEPSPETIAMWKATAASTHYLAPKVPI